MISKLMIFSLFGPKDIMVWLGKGMVWNLESNLCFSKHQGLIEAIEKIQKWKGIYWDGFTPNNDCQFWKPFPIFILFLRI